MAVERRNRTLFQSSPVAWVTSGGGANDNYALVWGVDTKTPSVPEPGSLMLLGIGLVGIGNKLRRR
jgi:hypothetical protein